MFKYYKSYPIGLDRWDGSDIFMLEESEGSRRTRHYKCITKDLMQVLKQEKITAITLESLADADISASVIEMRSKKKT